jgi:hypothetical protein
VHQDKPALVQGLGAALGVPALSNVWLYLNKGIHEEANRDDYDPNLVRTIVENLETLNQLQLGSMSLLRLLQPLGMASSLYQDGRTNSAAPHQRAGQP